MSLHNTFEKSISEFQLKALYSLLPGVLKENFYGPKFSKQLQVWREALHPSGKIDIRRLDGFDGLTVEVNLGDRLGCDFYYGFIQESWDYNLFMATLKPGDVVADIGSNFGMYTLGAAKRLAPNGRVFAFEPDVRSLSLLNKNIQLNKFGNLVTCLDTCIGSYDGEVGFYAAADPSFSGIYDTNRSETSDHLNLQIRRLDSVMLQLGVSQVDQIKIDVEGAESEVLEGATEVLASSDAIIMLEVSSKNLDLVRLEKLYGIFTILETKKYVAFHIASEGSHAELLIDENLKEIARKVDGKTTNYFLVKRNGKRFQDLQNAFTVLEKDPYPLQGNGLLVMGGPRLENNNLKKDKELLDHLYAIIWAAGIEKQIALASCRQDIVRVHTLESNSVEISKKLKAHEEGKTAFKTKLVETSKKLIAAKEELITTKNELIAAKEELITTKNELIEAKNELATMNSGLLGLLFTAAKRRWLSKGSLND